MQLKLAVSLCLLAVCLPASAQQDEWAWSHRLELRGDYRWSADEYLDRPFPTGAKLETPDPGHHVELNVADIQLDVTYGDWINARVKAHGYAKHRANPTSNDKTADVDELFIRFGPKPEFLERPDHTTFFLQAGKFTKMERQPVRLLESYGLAATSFNRFEDIQVQVGGTVGRSFYWRAQAANGNPLFLRDANALAGDNGAPERIQGKPNVYGSGFPIFYNAETEDLFFETDHVQWGEGIGYRWQREDQTAGFDVLLFHYDRELADREELTGTVYGGDLDLLNRPLPTIGPEGFRLDGRNKREYGARVYGEWHGGTLIAQFTKQNIAGLQRYGWEVETGYRFPLSLGWVESIQPAFRISGLQNDFNPAKGDVPAEFPAASLWWNWLKGDAGVRVGMKHGVDVTAEYTRHNTVTARTIPRQFNMQEVLVTVRWRV
ncbi:MAG TPA: hypothetical protein VF787_02390 [Thermoanaerobaculia bacterium]